MRVRCIERFLLGAIGALGTVVIQESYRMYKSVDPVSKILEERKRKKRFDSIISQTDLREDLV